jgi:hypothetical protein
VEEPSPSCAACASASRSTTASGIQRRGRGLMPAGAFGRYIPTPAPGQGHRPDRQARNDRTETTPSPTTDNANRQSSNRRSSARPQARDDRLPRPSGQARRRNWPRSEAQAELQGQWDREKSSIESLRRLKSDNRAHPPRGRGGERQLDYTRPRSCAIQASRPGEAVEPPGGAHEEGKLRLVRRRSARRRGRDSPAGPASRDQVLEGEREKLCAWRPAPRAGHRPGRGRDRGGRRRAPGPAGLKNPNGQRSSVPGPHRLWASRAVKALAAALFDTEENMIPWTCPSTWRSTRVRLNGAPRATSATTGRPAHRGRAPQALRVVLFDEMRRPTRTSSRPSADPGRRRLTDSTAHRGLQEHHINMTSNLARSPAGATSTRQLQARGRGTRS